MEKFPHLKLIKKTTGLAAFPQVPPGKTQSDKNRANREGHSQKLQRWVDAIRLNWKTEFDIRKSQELAPLDEDTATVFFQINPSLLQPDFDLESLGIELISEEDDGYIIGTSSDNFRTLEEKISGFIARTRSTGKIADLWTIIDGNHKEWRTEHILSEELLKKWHTIRDNDIIKLEVSIAFAKPLRARPDESQRGGASRLLKYLRDQELRDDAMLARQNHFQQFISYYGRLISSIIELEDSFGVLVEISGKGLKDLVENYPFVFEVVEIEDSSVDVSINEETEFDRLEILPPLDNAPVVGVIDSGIMEGHKFLRISIDQEKSRSYLDKESSAADYVPNGGHGTKIAGAVLYPNGVSTLAPPYRLPCFIRNIRILNKNNSLEDRYPADLMNRIITDNEDCKLFNLSVCSKAPFRKKHMSSWAAMIDKLTHENDVLFIVAAGNIPFHSIQTYLGRNLSYPDYLYEDFCRIANPAQSSFAISVGSINHSVFDDIDWSSLGDSNSISGYSRIGHGIWNHIKPDLVEFGGGIVTSKDGNFQIKSNEYTSVELLRSTLNGGTAIGKVDVGTSFSAPKVTHIAAILKSIYPDEGNNLMRALLVQGARLPGDLFINPSQEIIRQLGYGIPSLDRVVRNTEHRITFYDTNSIGATAAYLYTLQIPDSLRSPGDDYDVLIEVTLAYTAPIRRTRQKLKSYLGTWLDWISSKPDETFDDFSARAIKHEDSSDSSQNDSATDTSIQWKIREKRNWGEVQGLNRNQSSLQKDWVILKSHQLPEALSFAVRAHKGWDKSSKEVPFALTVSIEVLGAEIPIYEEIKIENQAELNVEVEIEL